MSGGGSVESKPFEIGVWLKPINGAPVRRAVYTLDRARAVIDYAMGSSLIDDWGFYDPAEEDVPAPDLKLTGRDHRRTQRVKPSDL